MIELAPEHALLCGSFTTAAIAERESQDDQRSMKIRDIIKTITRDGWSIDRQKGSHRIFIHPTKPGTVTIAGHPGNDVRAGTLRSILKQAGLD